MTEAAQRIRMALEERGVDEPLSEIDNMLAKLLKLHVPAKEAEETLTASLLKRHGVKPKSVGGGGNRRLTISQITDKEMWCDVLARVKILWEPKSNSVAQSGILEDETGQIAFTAWAKAELPMMEEGQVYLISSAVSDEYKGKISLKLNSTSKIEEQDVEVGSVEPVEFTGCVVDVQEGSGLIKRCPTCNKPLQKDQCKEHGKVKGVQDLRIKAVLDDGKTTKDFVAGRDVTAQAIGITLDQAKDMAMRALDTGVVYEEIVNRLFGKYVTVKGAEMFGFINAESIKPYTATDEAKEAAMKALCEA